MNEHTHSRAAHTHGTHVEPGSVIDPVCGMAVDPHTTPHRHTYQGRPYYFCSAGCRTKFAAAPARYLSPTAATATPVPMAISVNMLRLRVRNDCQPRTKNGQPAHSTTGVAKKNCSMFEVD